METIGDRIRTRRTALNMTRAQVGATAGLSHGAIRDIELGDSRSTTKLHLVAKALKVNVEWLETGRGEMNASESNSDPLHTPVTAIDAAILARAMYWAEIEEDARGVAYQLVRRAERIIALYGMQVANGGDLNADQVVALVESAHEAKGVVSNGGSNRAQEAL